jgi:hypothetical protein
MGCCDLAATFFVATLAPLARRTSCLPWPVSRFVDSRLYDRLRSRPVWLTVSSPPGGEEEPAAAFATDGSTTSAWGPGAAPPPPERALDFRAEDTVEERGSKLERDSLVGRPATGRRVRNMVLVWLLFGVVAGAGSGPPGDGVIGVAGVMILPLVGAALGLLGGRRRRCSAGGRCARRCERRVRRRREDPSECERLPGCGCAGRLDLPRLLPAPDRGVDGRGPGVPEPQLRHRVSTLARPVSATACSGTALAD